MCIHALRRCAIRARLLPHVTRGIITTITDITVTIALSVWHLRVRQPTRTVFISTVIRCITTELRGAGMARIAAECCSVCFLSPSRTPGLVMVRFLQR